MTEPDSFFPEVFTLDQGNVQAVQTSETFPKTRLDSNGITLSIVDAFSNVNAVRWLDTVTQKIRGMVLGGSIAGFPDLTSIQLKAQSTDSDIFPSRSAAFSVQIGDVTEAGAQPNLDVARVTVGNTSKKVLDSNGQSDFLKTVGPMRSVGFNVPAAGAYNVTTPTPEGVGVPDGKLAVIGGVQGFSGVYESVRWAAGYGNPTSIWSKVDGPASYRVWFVYVNLL